MTVKQEWLIQVGNQADFETVAAPTVELSGITDVSMPPSIVTEIISETLRGGTVPGRDTVDLRHEVQGVSVQGHLIFEQFMYFLDMLDEATPSGSGPYTYAYVGPTSSAPTPRDQVLTVGADDGIRCVVGARSGGLTIDFEWGQYVTFNCDIVGHNVEPDALAALDEAASLTYATGAQVTVYVDDFTGTIGTTSYCCRRGSITINPQRQYKRCTGSLYPTDTYDAPFWEITGSVTLEQTATTAGWVDALIAGGTKKLLRIAITNGGATTAERSLTIDVPVLISVDELFTDDDNLVTVDLSFRAIEEGDWTNPATGEVDGYFSMSLVNNTATAY